MPCNQTSIRQRIKPIHSIESRERYYATVKMKQPQLKIFEDVYIV